jgi:LPPG:FO 2-phospho-L-lactate transferase
VLDAIEAAETILVCPSNPIVSIGPILAVPGVREALDAARAPIVAVSPIVGGAPLDAEGIEVSALGVAGFYRDWIDGFVFDERDAQLQPEIEGLGLVARFLDTMMVDAEVSERVARAALAVARECA